MTFDDTTTEDELFAIKKNIEDWLMIYQTTSEGLEWHNPYSDKFIDSIEYFPRETSKPIYDYAYQKYYDLDNNSINIVNNMIMHRKNIRKNKIEYINNLLKI